jgi:excisionase family DNA binding protein
MNKDFYSVKEFAEKVGVSTDTIRRALKNGRISFFRVGGSLKSTIRIAHSEIQRLSVVELGNIVKKMAKEKK